MIKLSEFTSREIISDLYGPKPAEDEKEDKKEEKIDSSETK